MTKIPIEKLLEQVSNSPPMPPPPGEGEGCTCPTDQPLSHEELYTADAGCPLHGLQAMFGENN